MTKKILVTGAFGFIGHHFVEHILKNTDWDIVALDRLDSAATFNRLSDMTHWEDSKKRVKAFWHDLKAPINEYGLHKIGKMDYIVHLAASSHVDRSIKYPMEFVMDNVVGTANILEFARTQDNLEKFVYFSTDEVFGPAPAGVDFKEWDRYKGSNPYAATKAGGEELAVAWENTYKLPIIITHCMNVFGERQHPEKYVPMVVKKIMMDEHVPIHTDPTKTNFGSRFYIHARDVSDAVLYLLTTQTRNGDKYNIRGYREVDNMEMAQMIAKFMDKELKYDLVDFHSTRPGHDLRYALDGSKLRDMGWMPKAPLEARLEKCVKWMVDRPAWLFIDTTFVKKDEY